MERGSEKPMFPRAGAHVTESLLSQTPAPAPPHKTRGSWLRLAVDESLGVEQRLPNSFHLFSFY